MSTHRFLLAAVVAVLVVASSSVRAQTAQQTQRLQLLWSSGLGIYGTPVNDALVRDLNLGRPKGILVLAVSQRGPADRANIKAGDLLVAFSPEMWSDQDKDGTIQLVRGGKDQVVSLRSGKIAALDAPLLRPVGASRAPASLVVDTNGAGDFRTLTAAMLRAKPGDTIFLKPGGYRDEVLLPQNVKIRATDKLLARVEAEYPWRFHGPGSIEISGAAFSGGGLVIDGADGAVLTDCAIESTGKGTGILVRQSKGVTVARCSFAGGAETDGIIAAASQIQVTDSFFSGHGGNALNLNRGSQGMVSKNLFEGNANGIDAQDSTLTATANIFTGLWSPEKKDAKAEFGIRALRSTATLSKNTLRRHRFGIIVKDAPVSAKIGDSTVTQGQWGVYVEASPAVLIGNLVMQNEGDGIHVVNDEKNPRASPPEVTLSRNTISGNDGDGISIAAFSRVTVSENLIEANGVGIRLDQSAAIIEKNTVVLQRRSGVRVQANSNVGMHNNIIAFNSFGVEFDVTATKDFKYNDIYGNLASREFPLVDGNYSRIDRYITRDGKKVPLDVYPSYDLKSETDVSVDPGFVKLGSDYNLAANSALVGTSGKGESFIGAYAPTAAGLNPPIQRNDTSNASYRPPSSTTSASTLAYSVYDSHDVDGGDLSTLRKTDLGSCIAACKAEPQCQAYSFDKWNRYCFLKSGIDALRLDPRSITGIRQDLPTPSAASDPINMERYRGKVFPGDGYKTIAHTQFETCQSTCNQEQACVAFTFEKKNQLCHLFDTTGEYFANSQTDSGIKRQAP
jgi:parallel beta-helix repeat protein